MKTFKLLKSLLIAIGLLVTSLTTQVWGWSKVSLRGDMKGIGWDPGYAFNSESGSGSTETYAAYGNGFKLYIHAGVNAWVGYCNTGPYSASSLTSDGSHSHLYKEYGGNANQNVTYTGCNGIVCFYYSNGSDATNDNPDVWITRPTVHLKNNWNTGSWSWKSTTDEGNGYYYVDANYGADGVNWGTNGSSAWQKSGGGDVYITAKTKYPTTISAGTKVRYRLNTNPSGSSWNSETPTLTIHKILTITYYDNGKTSGTKPANQEVPHSIATPLATNSGNMAKTGYVFTGWNTQADGQGTHYDAGASITITANTNLYAEWNRKWAVQGSGTEMGAWSKFNYLAPTGNANEFSGTIDLAANTTYVFKLRNREDNSLWGYGDNGDYQLAYIGQSSAHAHNLESTDGKKNLVLMSAKTGTYTFTYNQSTKRLTVGFPSQTHPNTNNIYFKNSGASPYTGVCINIYGGVTGGVSGWERMPSMPSCTIDGQTYYYSAIGDNTKCKFANAANSGTNTGEKTGIQSNKGKYYDLATNTWKSFVFDITYKDQGNVAFSGTHNDSPSTHPTTHTFGSSTNLNTANKTGYTFGGWFTNSSCTGSAVSTLTATGYTADITLYAKWTPITYTIRYYSNSASYIGTATDTTAVSSHTYDVAKNLNSNGFNLTGYAFGGWSTTTGTSAATYTDGESVTNLSSTNGATVDLYARWTPIDYSITYNLNGGENHKDNPEDYNIESSTITLQTPTKSGYSFGGWYEASDFSGSAVTSIPSGSIGNKVYYAKWNQSITLNQNEADKDGSSSLAATYNSVLSTAGITNPNKIGKSFAGWTNGSGGTGSVIINADGTVNTVASWTDSDKKWIHAGESTLYAKWEDDMNTFTNDDGDGDWNNENNWSADKVPTNDYSAVTIDGDVTLSSYVHIGQLTIGEGKLTISSTGTLEVAGIVTNTNADKLEIQTTTSSQGALIYDISSPPAATVIMKLNGSGFHLIASPTGGARVSSTFAGSGIYTYAWEEGKGWDRRGYYDDFVGNEAILIYGQTNCNFSGTLANYCGGSLRYTAEPDDANAQGVNMLANPLTAPIRIANMTISNSEDGAVHLYNGSWVGKAPGSAGEAVIPAMQGYGVIASSGGGTVSFDYDVAVRRASSKNAPLNAPKRTDSDIQDHITVSVTTNDRKVDLELYENAQFTEGIDVGWEAIYMEGSGQFGELYAIADKKMNILATPNLEGTVLGFVPGQAESYVISFEGDGKGYYLNDTELELSTLINEGNTYEFTPNESTNATRFVISKTPIRNTPTGLEEVSEGTKARKQLIDGVLYIIRDGRIYNTTGALYK